MSDKLKEIGRTSRGYTIFVEKAGHGGNRYISDEIGGGVCIYDTMVCQESINLAMKYENIINEVVAKRNRGMPETFTRYIASYGDDRFQERSLPIGVIEIQGYYKQAKIDDRFENQWANDSGILFVRTDQGGEELISYHEAFVTREEAQLEYNKECLWRIDRYQSRVDALRAAIK